MILVYNNSVKLAEWLEPLWREHFDLQVFDPTANYTPDQHVMYAVYTCTDWTEPFRQAGFSIVVDNLWDSFVDEPCEVQDNVLTLRSRDWIWIEESLWYRHLGYHTFVFDPNYHKLFLLLMHGQRPHRDHLYRAITPYLHNSLHSYVEKGIVLENDIDYSHGNWQRHMNPNWYNDTCFSLVAESTVYKRLWISEKTFKPLAFCHPFIVYGSPGTLQYIRDIGFETFAHVVDESYDNLTNNQQRLAHITAQVQQLEQAHSAGVELFSDPESRRIIRHNFEHYYNSALVKQMFVDQIIAPIKEFLCRR